MSFCVIPITLDGFFPGYSLMSLLGLYGLSLLSSGVEVSVYTKQFLGLYCFVEEDGSVGEEDNSGLDAILFDVEVEEVHLSLLSSSEVLSKCGDFLITFFEI